MFCAKALAGIDNGRWPDTLLDRSVVIRAHRKLETETVARLKFSEAEAGGSFIRDILKEWAERHLDLLRDADPVVPGSLSDRAADAWEPLLAIADLLDGDWPLLARQAAEELFQSEENLEDTLQLALLRDVRAIFDASAQDRLKSIDLADALRRLPDSAWKNWGAKRGQKGVQPNDVAMILRPFEIQPYVIRLDKFTTPSSPRRVRRLGATCEPTSRTPGPGTSRRTCDGVTAL